jgi:hypothetical protein
VIAEDINHRARSGARTHETGEAMTKLADIKKRLMANPEFEKEYAAADAEFSRPAPKPG